MPSATKTDPKPPRPAPVMTYLSEIRETGNLAIVTPGPIDDQMPLIRLEIDEARELHRAGLCLDASKLVLKIEKRLEITSDERIAAARGEPWEGDLEAALLALSPARDKPEETEVDRMPVPRDFRRYNEAEERRIDQINQERLRAKMRGNRGNVALAEGKLADIAQRRHQRVELKERGDGIAETISLAKGRGEEVDERPALGAVDIESRDGLARMRKLGHITAEHERVGLVYRAGCETRGADLKAQVITDAGGSGGHDNDAFVAKRLERAKLLDFVSRVDRAVALGCISNPAALQMLRHVAGASGNISDFGKGRGLTRHREALVAALEIAVRVWRDRLGDENPGETSTKPGAEATS